MASEYWHNVNVPFPDSTYKDEYKNDKQFAILLAKITINLYYCWKDMGTDAGGSVYNFIKQKSTIEQALVTLRILEAIDADQKNKIYAELQT
jgi:hypothetical protein